MEEKNTEELVKNVDVEENLILEANNCQKKIFLLPFI